MLRKEQNDLLTRPDQRPDGRIVPALLAAALLADELPRTSARRSGVKLLSERLLAFRIRSAATASSTSSAPTAASLCGSAATRIAAIRCPYHGWKYDLNGNCLEVPSEPEESGFRQKIKLNSYPLVDAAGCCGPIWAAGLSRRCRRLSSRSFPPSRASPPALAGMQLAASDGGRHRFQPRFLPAQGNLNSDPLFKGARGTVQPRVSMPFFEVADHPAAFSSGAPQR